MYDGSEIPPPGCASPIFASTWARTSSAILTSTRGRLCPFFIFVPLLVTAQSRVTLE